MITVADIQRVVAEAHSVTVADMTQSHGIGTSAPDRVRARHEAMFLCREIIRVGSPSRPISMPAIGRRFGNRDHTTVLHALRVIAERRQSDPRLRINLRRIEWQLRRAVRDTYGREKKPTGRQLRSVYLECRP